MLTQMKCVSCSGDVPTATAAEVAGLHPQVPDWQIVERDGIDRLTRAFAWPTSPRRSSSRGVGELAEEEGHHPARDGVGQDDGDLVDAQDQGPPP